MMTSTRNPFARYDTKPPPGFPAKFSALPGIGNNGESPPPTGENQLMPYASNGPGGGRSPLVSLRSEESESERLRQLETRVNVTERSNRALLEEVVRLQSELKGTLRRQDDQIREEKTVRQQLENSLRVSNDLVAQLSARLQRAEEKISEDKSAVSQMMSQAKGLEQAVLNNQQESASRRDLQSVKLQELRGELDETQRAKDQLERVTFQMVDELRQLKGKVDTQGSDVSTLVNDLKNRSKKLEEENRHAYESMRKHGESQTQSEKTLSQLRTQIEQRLSELRDVIVDLRNKSDTETQERRMLEQSLQLKLADTNASIAEETRRRDEHMHALDVMQREKEHAAETERLRLQSKIAEIAEEVSKKILQKEIRLREENQAKFAQIEQMFANEEDTKQRFEKESREEAEKRWEALKNLQEEELKVLKETQKNEKKKTSETLHKLNEACNLLEQQLEEQKRHQDKILQAEITSRQEHESKTINKIDDIQDKLAAATQTLQQAIGGVSTQMSGQAEKIRNEVRQKLEEDQSSHIRHLADIDTRLVHVTSRISQSEDRLEAKIASASALQSQNVREKVQSISLWQEVTQQTLRELQHQAQITPNELRDLQEKHSAFRSEVDTRVKSEADERLKDVEKLKVEIERIRGQSGDKKADTSEIEARKTEMAALEEQVRKLNEIVERLKQEDLKNKEKKAEDKNDDKDSEKEDDKDKDEDKESEKNKDGDKKSEADDREDDKKSEKNKDGDKKRKKEDKKDKDDDKDERTAEDLRKL